MQALLNLVQCHGPFGLTYVGDIWFSVRTRGCCWRVCTWLHLMVMLRSGSCQKWLVSSIWVELDENCAKVDDLRDTKQVICQWIANLPRGVPLYESRRHTWLDNALATNAVNMVVVRKNLAPGNPMFLKLLWKLGLFGTECPFEVWTPCSSMKCRSYPWGPSRNQVSFRWWNRWSTPWICRLLLLLWPLQAEKKQMMAYSMKGWPRLPGRRANMRQTVE